MSDSHSVKDSAQDQAALEALARLEDENPQRQAPLSEEAQRCLEALASLPYALEPVAPLPETRERLLERAAAAARQDRPPASVRRFPPAAQATAVPGWMKLLAAGLMAAVVGLGLLTLRLSESLQNQREEIASLTQAMMVGHQEAEARADSYIDLASDPRLAQVHVTGSRLYPIGSWDARESDPHGAVFVCAKHQRWYLRLDGLRPPPGDQTYRLWFITGAGAVPVSKLEVLAGQPVEVSADRMPPDTRGILISMDPDAPTEAPPDRGQVVVEGREVLHV